MILRTLCFLFVFPVFALLAGQPSAAEDVVPIPETVTLDSKIYTRQQLLYAFLDAVFTKDTLNENNLSIPMPYKGGELFSRENIKKAYPWLYPHLYPENGLPRLMTVNKWVKPVHISFGMPSDLKTLSRITEGNEQEFSLFDLYPETSIKDQEYRKGEVFKSLEDDIGSLSNQLSDLTNLNVNYIPHDKETDDKYAEIRINLVSRDIFNGDEYKLNGLAGKLRFGMGEFIPKHFRFVEKQIKTGFVFTADSKKQVDGYFLSNANNEIEMAVCYIWREHELPMLKALVNECVIRSMGLAGAVQMHIAKTPMPESFLTLWNDPNQWAEQYRAKVHASSGLSEFDQYLIRALYDPSIKAGMDYIQAQKILSEENLH